MLEELGALGVLAGGVHGSVDVYDEPLWPRLPLRDEVMVLVAALRAGPVLDHSRLPSEHLAYVLEAGPVSESNAQVCGRLDDAPCAVAAYAGVSLKDREAS